MKFWAKTTKDNQPGISIYSHLINVGLVAQAFSLRYQNLIQKFRLSSSDISVLAAFHDVGKLCLGFQLKCDEWTRQHISKNEAFYFKDSLSNNHSLNSQALVFEFLHSKKGIHTKIVQHLAALVGAHHGRIQSTPSEHGVEIKNPLNPDKGQIDWKFIQDETMQKVWDFFQAQGDFNHFKPKIETSEVAEMCELFWMAGLITVSDWIGSNETWFPADKDVIAQDDTVHSSICDLGLNPVVIRKGLKFNDLFGDQNNTWSPNSLQMGTIATITSPGVYVIEAPMGMGKTEAALWASYRLLETEQATGIYFALPTQATSNRIFERFQDFVTRICPEVIPPQLIHSNSWLMKESQKETWDIQINPDDYKTSNEQDARAWETWFNSSKRALIAPFGVGTIDQALLAVVGVKHFFVRHFALAGKVVILDEVHSYDVYTGTLIDHLIKTLQKLGCTVIILSATLTQNRRDTLLGSSTESPLLNHYPLITGMTKVGPIEPFLPKSTELPRDVAISFRQLENSMEEAIRLAQSGGVVLWICNTVSHAQNTYLNLVKTSGNNLLIGLLHSRFPFYQREKIETEWMRRLGKEGKNRCGCILVSTQIVEQSVDLDADLLITELAPTDMILQRIGRLFRHKRENRPVDAAKVIILEEELPYEELVAQSDNKIKKILGPKAKVYSPYVLMRSLEVLRTCASHPKIELPTDIRKLIEITYSEKENESPGMQELMIEMQGKQVALRSQARMGTNVWTILDKDEEGYKTRSGDIETVNVILYSSCTGKNQIQFLENDRRYDFAGDKRKRLQAIAVHRHLVKVPTHYFEDQFIKNRSSSQDFYSKALNPYLFALLGRVSADGRVQVKFLKSGHLMLYTEDIGLRIENI